MAAPERISRDRPLGELLVEEGYVSPSDLEDALAEAHKSRRRLGEILVEWAWVDERTLAQLVAEQEELDFVDLGKYDVDREAAMLLPEKLARTHEAIAYGFGERAVLVAVADPVDGAGLDAVREALGRPICFLVATSSEIQAALAEAYGG